LPSEPIWLAFEAAIEINQTVVAITGERHLLRDQGLLESALARPQNALAYGEEDLVVLAVKILAGIAQSHSFEQGNKRTAFVAMALFLRMNGYELTIEDTESWADAVISLIEHRSTEEDFVQAIRPFVVPTGSANAP
jgi:death-on-curing protein